MTAETPRNPPNEAEFDFHNRGDEVMVQLEK
jgi:hypothetical protein